MAGVDSMLPYNNLEHPMLGGYVVRMGIESTMTGRSGVFTTASILTDELGWIFREQPELDQGIDAVVEEAVGGRGTGTLVALQIKSSASRFATPTAGGWTLTGPKRHLEYWLGYSIPVLLVIVDTRKRTAFWAHVSSETARFTPGGYAIEIPARQRLDAASGALIKAVIQRWSPQVVDPRRRALTTASALVANGVPVPPSSGLFDVFMSGAKSGGNGVQIDPCAVVFNLKLRGDTPAVAENPDKTTCLFLSSLSGTWWVPSGTEVYVCENPVIVREAAAALGDTSRALLCTNGVPNLAAEYLLLGLGFCGARIRVHTDHDEYGRYIMRTLFHRLVAYEAWCSVSPGARRRLVQEEACLPHIINDLRT